LAPEAVNVVVVIVQSAFIPLTVITEIGFTTTVLVAVAIHPLAFVPVTVYTVVVEGLTCTESLCAPVLHVYVLASDAVKVVFCPAQIV
jgi:hypothetical protein